MLTIEINGFEVNLRSIEIIGPCQRDNVDHRDSFKVQFISGQSMSFFFHDSDSCLGAREKLIKAMRGEK
jgi:hypothetical protein